MISDFMLQFVRIDELLLTQPEVKKKKVAKLAMVDDESLSPVLVDFCIHNGKFYLNDGHHSVASRYFKHHEVILANVEPCYALGQGFMCEGSNDDYKYAFNVRHIRLE